jgi:hypothetical protein
VRDKALLILILAAACFDINLHRETYRDGRMARAFGAYDRGIVPAFIPDNARNITTANHDVTGAVWLRCELPGDTLSAVTAGVQPVGWAEAHANAEAAPEFLGEWHPVLCSGPLIYTPEATSTYFVYRQSSREWHGVIDPSQRICFAYCLTTRPAPAAGATRR